MTAEEDRLRQEVEEYADLTGRMSRLLTLTANALKGEPDELKWHDWSDLPVVAAELVAQLQPRTATGVVEAVMHAVEARP